MPEGKAHVSGWMQLSANAIAGAKEISKDVTSVKEELVIIKSGFEIISSGIS